ncbi:MAG: aminodeoxychorismate/anthranilate synthase component II [Ignavibacteriae bacterium]|nr:aminodeoxychorismate/anthranilate synthase component II [Ignavibacteria bacterium]MBI3363481.1 aminodeoxychorismate/anthranilate synthase component II [Ignavibacteriota bacterium]
MILVIDNYDSFTYNLVQLVAQHTKDFRVVRNDTLSVAEVEAIKPNRILISPGPGRPENAGICVDLIRTLGIYIPVLGVCLGHQAIGYAFGGKIIHAPQLMHGKTSYIQHGGEGIFEKLPNPFEATRYHSLVISSEGFPKELNITARTADNVIMGVRHASYPIEGIQFHPESVLTKPGYQLIANWIHASHEAHV